MSSLATLTEAVLALAAAYAVLCLASPTRRCPACKGRKVTRARNGHAPCGRCKGHGRANRPGARLIHRAVWEHAAPRVRGRIRDAVERRRENGS